jgi:hypothetical protein
MKTYRHGQILVNEMMTITSLAQQNKKLSGNDGLAKVAKLPLMKAIITLAPDPLHAKSNDKPFLV